MLRLAYVGFSDLRSLWTSVGVKTPRAGDLPVGTALMRRRVHLMLLRTLGGCWGAEAAIAGRALWRASEKCGRAAVSWCVVVLAPPHRTRLPLGVHLAAETLTCVGLESSRNALMVEQMSAGEGLLSVQV
jgi:hypothetical protein